MKVQGQILLAAARGQVWDLLTDPAKLAKCLPGCEKLEAAGPDRYKVSVKFALAAISGSYSGAVELSEKKQPESLRIMLEGKGTPGFMKGEGRIRLTEKQGQTELRYEGEAQVGGMIAAVGQRMIDVAARRIIQQFFDAAAAQLRSSVPGA
ncbi:MAG: carbon monoxide dehydrogenase subunit G [Acidobacteria bacterium]|nr:carbon monoxide dehydrogenase subunit G [Acidobacteriota bacterium]MBI3661616.1 carbon monoxide dehydrogenase subunit G [Acidobacteriota bacterium]